MNLTPKLPPGRANRKALAFGPEIHRLRAAGYTFEAIRQALLEAGIEVSLTTVKREAARRPATPVPQPRAPKHPPPPSPAAFQAPSGMSVAPQSFVGDARTGKEIAEAFMKSRITNPLLLQRNPR
jgi:hypothetical protein